MFRSNYKKCLIIFTFCLLSLPLHAEELIKNFHSHIDVNADGSLTITENIVVQHEGNKIKRGIYRDLSTSKGEHYQIITVARNEKPEPWFVEKKSGFLRLNTGNNDFLPSPAISTYTITYIMYDALRKIKDEDLNELYLNITGKWDFPIEKVTAEVHYPPQTKVIRQYGYQTALDDKSYPAGAPFEFKGLLPKDEVTIAQAFSTGTVNIGIPLIVRWQIIAGIIMLAYYIIVWYFFGKDPKARPIVPDWTPPSDLTPLECAYINENGVKPKNSLFIHIIWLLHKHAVKIMETDAPASLFGTKKFYTLTTQPGADTTDREIKEYCENYPNILTLTGTPSAKLASYVENLSHNINLRAKKEYYHTRGFLTFLGAMIFPAIMLIPFPEYINTGVFYLTVIIGFFFSQVTLRKSDFFIMLLLIIAFLSICLAMGSSSETIISLITYTLITFTFTYLMFQPTIIGQRKREQIDGLKMFLKTINTNSTEQIDSKEDALSMDKRLTPRDMEALFPYAVALGLEKAWTKKFKNIFGDETYLLMSKQIQYNPTFRTKLCDMCFQTATPPSSTVPGIASHGGGFAGGGFGGGGGGGR